MRHRTKFIAVLAVGLPLLAASPAWAETYTLPIEGGQSILKIFLDNGTARRVATTPMSATFEVEMDAGQCVTELRLTFSDTAPTLRTTYDVCSEKGFGITLRRQRW